MTVKTCYCDACVNVSSVNHFVSTVSATQFQTFT